MSGVPEYRKSQGIVPYGVGAIVDFPDNSLMAAGLDMWPQVSSNMPADRRARILEATQIIDGRLRLFLRLPRGMASMGRSSYRPWRRNTRAEPMRTPEAVSEEEYRAAEYRAFLGTRPLRASGGILMCFR